VLHVADAEGEPEAVRQHKAGEVAGEDGEDADVEEIAGEQHALVREQLRGVGLPGVLLALVAQPAADDEDGEHDIRVHREDEFGEVHGRKLR